jgi:hypothetical protein
MDGTNAGHGLTHWTALREYRAMLGESENQFSLTRVALSTSGREKNSFRCAAFECDYLILIRKNCCVPVGVKV